MGRMNDFESTGGVPSLLVTRFAFGIEKRASTGSKSQTKHGIHQSLVQRSARREDGTIRPGTVWEGSWYRGNIHSDLSHRRTSSRYTPRPSIPTPRRRWSEPTALGVGWDDIGMWVAHRQRPREGKARFGRVDCVRLRWVCRRRNHERALVRRKQRWARGADVGGRAVRGTGTRG